MKKLGQKLFFIASKISGKIKNIIPCSLRWKIKEIFLRKSVEDYLKKKKTGAVSRIYPQGINLIGNIRAEMGLGQSCRLLADMILKCGCQLSVYNTNTNNNVKKGDASFDGYISDELPYGVNIFHVNPIELGKLFMQMSGAWKGRYNIAFWLWELEEFPVEWYVYCDLFDEIWVPSQFVADSICKITDVPVRVIPYFITVSYERGITRNDFGLPEDRFLFLVMFDVNSTLGRKNPLGAVRAFKQAFLPEDGRVGLVIKINNADAKKMAVLKKELKGYKNVYLITETLKKERLNCLIACADVFVSLHRAEGFGLVMAEAMMSGTPSIATDWSANVEFMDAESACMVNYRLIKNPVDEDLYRKGCIWAEPDCEQAAAYMKRLTEDREYYTLLQENGRKYIKEKLGEKNTIDILKREIDRIWAYINTKQE